MHNSTGNLKVILFTEYIELQRAQIEDCILNTKKKRTKYFHLKTKKENIPQNDFKHKKIQFDNNSISDSIWSLFLSLSRPLFPALCMFHACVYL